MNITIPVKLLNCMQGQSNCLYSMFSDRRQDYLGSPFLDEYKFDVELVETVFFADEKR